MVNEILIIKNEHTYVIETGQILYILVIKKQKNNYCLQLNYLLKSNINCLQKKYLNIYLKLKLKIKKKILELGKLKNQQNK